MENNSKEKNNIDNSQKTKDKKMIIRRIIFVILFLIISVSITIYLIKHNVSDNKDLLSKEETKSESKVVNYNNLTLDDTYSLNKLRITEYNEEYKELDLKYYQIDGLKDNSIQTKINYALKNDIEEFIDKIIENNEIVKNLSQDAIIVSNFANLLSIQYYVQGSSSDYNEDDYEDYNWVSKNLVENYDLTTGNKLKLNDLFVEGANAGNIISSKIYEDVVAAISERDGNDELISKIKDYNDVEEEIFDIVNRYNNKKDINFVFDQQKITLVDYYADIPYKDYLNVINIYSKKDENIFDNRYYNIENIPVLAMKYDAEYAIIEEGENYYVDFSLFNSNNDRNIPEEVIASAKKIMENDFQEIKAEAKENPSKFIIANNSYEIYPNSVYNDVTRKIEKYYDTLKLNIQYYKFETTKSLYNSEIRNNILEVLRFCNTQEMGESYCWNNLFGNWLGYEDFLPGATVLKNVGRDSKEIVFNNSGEIISDSDANKPWLIND